jgi:hypothetical protein
MAAQLPMWLQPLMGTRNSSASRLYIHRVGQQSPLGFSGSAKSSLENIQAISTPRRDTEQKDHTGYHQPSRFWLRDGRRVSQDVERELALTGCDIPIKSVGAYCYCTCVSWSGKIPVIGRRDRGSLDANPVRGGSCSQHQGATAVSETEDTIVVRFQRLRRGHGTQTELIGGIWRIVFIRK